MSVFNIREFRQRKKRERLLEEARAKGAAAAIAHFKLADTMGADYGVAPSGDEQSHGTDTVTYAPSRGHENQDPNMPDWLFDLFATDRQGPGGAGGQYGTETIG